MKKTGTGIIGVVTIIMLIASCASGAKVSRVDADSKTDLSG